MTQEKLQPIELGKLGIGQDLVISVTNSPVAPPGQYDYEFLRLPDMAVRCVHLSQARERWFYLRVVTKKSLEGIDPAAAVTLLVKQFDDIVALGWSHGGHERDLRRESNETSTRAASPGAKGSLGYDSRMERDLYELLWPAKNLPGKAELKGLHSLRNWPNPVEPCELSALVGPDYSMILDLPRQTRLTIGDALTQRRSADNEACGHINLFGQQRTFLLTSKVHTVKMTELLCGGLDRSRLIMELKLFIGAAWPFLEEHDLVKEPRWAFDL